MGHKRNILMVAALAVLVVLLMGCSQSSIRLGWVETSSPGHLNASYGEFTGTETRTVLAQSGETLYLEYDAEVDNGSLHLEVYDPYGQAVWCVSLCDDCGETKTLLVSKAGCYTISIRGEATEGGFDLKWEQK
jgi:ABC-type Fe3+-hydroxamate transport system substrate-binding protein